MTTIRSSSNALAKRVRAVRAGREEGLVLLEGQRLVEEALRAGLTVDTLLVSEEHGELLDRLAAHGHAPQRASASLLQALTALRTSPGVLALVRRPPEAGLERAAERDALVVVAAGLADPGNLGALARVAEAAGCGALVTTAGGASPWNEKALRGSMGSLLRLPVVASAAAGDVAAELGRHGFRQVCAATRGGQPYDRADWSGRLALWIAGETGEAPAVAEGFAPVTIPMAGGVESLNVTAAAAVLLFAAARGRGERP